MTRKSAVSANELPEAPLQAVWWAAWSVVAAFGTYFCMYAFRKPFTAASFDELTVLGLTFKTVLVTSQVTGYMLSKFLGIRVVSELPPQRRAVAILVLIGLAEVALLLFGLVPRPWNALCLFLNGLPLGMVFGLVLGFLEGRQLTEALTAGLCASFIVADGVMKSVGAWLLQQGVSPYWMPGVAGLVFLLPLCASVWMLSRIPPPGSRDVEARAARSQMNRLDRRSLFSRFAVGLILLVVMYLLVTILRSVRADFAPELWRGLGEAVPPAVFTQSELWVALGVLVVNGAAILVRNNRLAFLVGLGTCGLGFALIAAALVSYRLHALGGFSFMVLVGLGLYLPYVAIHTTIFERLMAMTRARGNIGFLMYIADSIGYLGYVAVMLTRGATRATGDFLNFFEVACWLTCGVSLICLILSWRYFAGRRTMPAALPAAEGIS